MAEKLTPVSELVRRLYAEYEYPQVCSHGRDLMMLMDCAGCAEDIITAAVLEARRYELARAARIAGTSLTPLRDIHVLAAELKLDGPL